MEDFKYHRIDECVQEYEKLIKESPYHLNIIEELHANENAHSRILAKLFQYKYNGQYNILKSFIEYLKDNNPNTAFDKIVVHNPIITQEEERIDVWIRDDDFAMIIENKVYDAGDQEAQLSRYIDKTKQNHYDEEQIFVIYMPSFPRETSEQTWGEYKISYQNRFAVVSFFDDVISWLEQYVLPNLTLKEIYLKSAIEQYIDYLKRYAGKYEEITSQHISEMLQKVCEIDKKDSNATKYIKLMELHSELVNCISVCEQENKNLFDNIKKQFTGITNKHYNNYKIIWQKDNCWVQILKLEWAKYNIHFEWVNPSFFEGRRLIYVLHTEGGKKIWDRITANIEKTKSKDFYYDKNKLSYPTCYEKSYIIKRKSSFAELTQTEKEEFLSNVYSDFDFLIDIIDKTISDLK